MSNSIINLAIALGLATVAFGGYYIYTQQGGEELFFTNDERMMQDMLSQTRVFIERRQLLEAVELNTRLFDDPLFRNLEDYSSPLVEPPQGRDNPFAPLEPVQATSS